MCVCVCVCVWGCASERERERERGPVSIVSDGRAAVAGHASTFGGVCVCMCVCVCVEYGNVRPGPPRGHHQAPGRRPANGLPGWGRRAEPRAVGPPPAAPPRGVVCVCVCVCVFLRVCACVCVCV